MLLEEKQLLRGDSSINPANENKLVAVSASQRVKASTATVGGANDGDVLVQDELAILVDYDVGRVGLAGGALVTTADSVNPRVPLTLGPGGAEAGTLNFLEGSEPGAPDVSTLQVFNSGNGSNSLTIRSSGDNSYKLTAVNTVAREYALPDTDGTVVLTDSLLSSNAGKLFTASSTDGKIEMVSTVQKIHNYDSRTIYWQGGNFTTSNSGTGATSYGSHTARFLQGPNAGVGAGHTILYLSGVNGVDGAWFVGGETNGSSNGIFNWDQELCFFGQAYFTNISDNTYSYRISFGKLTGDGIGDLASGRKAFQIKFNSGTSSYLQFLVGSGTGSPVTVTSSYQPVANTRFKYMIHKEANSSTVNLYINGNIVATSTNAPSGTTSSSTLAVLMEEVQTTGSASSFVRMITGRGGMYGSDL